MPDYRPPPLREDLRDLDELREQVQQRFAAACRASEPLILLSDPPFVTPRPRAFVLRCDLLGIALAVAGVVAVFVWIPGALVLGAAAVLVWVARWIVHLAVVAPARRRLRECRVLPAVVVQAFPGGFRPPQGDSNTRPFTGIVVFSFDESVDVPRLRSLAHTCFAAKTGPDDGPLGEIKRLLSTGDNQFVHATVRLPAELAGNTQTYATPILFVRDNDLAGGYLSTAAQLILAHPDRPHHVCAVPLVLWQARRSIELLGDRRGDE